MTSERQRVLLASIVALVIFLLLGCVGMVLLAAVVRALVYCDVTVPLYFVEGLGLLINLVASFALAARLARRIVGGRSNPRLQRPALRAAAEPPGR